ncbi:MAG: DUF1292 domain-containing protein [Clostridia bacterium]|nr:DUF1292 domain-containing protein [Clostridia bacterium]
MTEEKKSDIELGKDEADNDEDFITLEFEDGEEIVCEIMGVFEVDGKEYIALIPDDQTDDVYIYGYSEISEEEFDLVDIEDDDEFNKVVEEFEKLTAEE